MAFEIQLDNSLVIKIDGVVDIQKFYNLMQKVNKKKFSVGFGVPNLNKTEKAMIEGFVASLQECGFSNPKLDNLTIEKTETKDEKKS